MLADDFGSVLISGAFVACLLFGCEFDDCWLLVMVVCLWFDCLLLVVAVVCCFLGCFGWADVVAAC